VHIIVGLYDCELKWVIMRLLLQVLYRLDAIAEAQPKYSRKSFCHCHIFIPLMCYGHVSRKDENVWFKSGVYKMEDVRLRGRPRKTWKEVVEKDCWTRQLNKEDAMDASK